MKRSVPEPARAALECCCSTGPIVCPQRTQRKGPRTQPEHRMALPCVNIVKYWAWVQMGNSYCPEPSRPPLMYPMPTQPLPGNF